MDIRLQKQTKLASASTPTPTGFLEQRAFTVQTNQTSITTQQHQRPDLQTQLDKATQFGHNFSRIQAKANRPIGIQPKLTIGQPGDKYEQEADRVADRVMAMSIPSGQQQVQRQEATEEEQVQTKSLFNTIQLQAEEDEEQVQTKSVADSITPLIQRQETAEEEEQVQTKQLQLKSTASSTLDTHSLENRLSAQKGSGSSLSNEVRAFMEPRFGVDFSQVRIHTSSEAVQMNRELNAQAFAHGSDIYFGAGKYNPSSGEGKRLLAHELTHVVQQTGGQRLSKSASLVLQAASNPKKNFTQYPTDIVSEKADNQVQRFRLRKLRNRKNHQKKGKKKIRFTVAADKDANWWTPEWYKDFNVGHSWIMFQMANQKNYSIGFWPAKVFDVKKPWKSVDGMIRNPDTDHKPTALMTVNIDRKQLNKGLEYAKSKAEAKYNLFGFNCTAFAREMFRETTGQNAPSGGLLIDDPNDLHASIMEENRKRGFYAKQPKASK